MPPRVEHMSGQTSPQIRWNFDNSIIVNDCSEYEGMSFPFCRILRNQSLLWPSACLCLLLPCHPHPLSRSNLANFLFHVVSQNWRTPSWPNWDQLGRTTPAHHMPNSTETCRTAEPNSKGSAEFRGGGVGPQTRILRTGFFSSSPGISKKTPGYHAKKLASMDLGERSELLDPW